jgi:hypothetical protein
MAKTPAKPCNTKLFCTQNILIFFVGFIGILVGYLYYMLFMLNISRQNDANVTTTANGTNVSPPSISINYESDPRVNLSNPYNPPLKDDTILLSKKNDVPQEIATLSPLISAPLAPSAMKVQKDLAQRQTPINVSTSTIEMPYTQMGILTKQTGKNTEPVILPLMGRNLLNGRDKWMYYTMTNSAGSINTRLPIRVNGKSGTNEYGCDMIYSGDVIYVDGYEDTFRATIYENAVLRYLPTV